MRWILVIFAVVGFAGWWSHRTPPIPVESANSVTASSQNSTAQTAPVSVVAPKGEASYPKRQIDRAQAAVAAARAQRDEL